MKLISMQINKLLRKELLTPVNLTWMDNALLGNVDSCSEGMIPLSDNVNVSMDSENTVSCNEEMITLSDNVNISMDSENIRNSLTQSQ